MTKPTPVRARCQGTTEAGQPCQNPPTSTTDRRYCQAHVLQAPKRGGGSPLGRVLSINSAHRSLIRRARTTWESDQRTPGQLARMYGGKAMWWGKIVTRGDSTPKFLHTKGVARLVRYLDATPVSNEEIPRQVEEEQQPQSRLSDLHEAWKKSKEPPVVEQQPDPEIIGQVDRLQQRLVALEAVVFDILESMTEEAS